jgi:hypothetical protein
MSNTAPITDPATTVAQPHIKQVQAHLMQTLAALCDRDNPMEIERARAMAQVAGVLVDTAKVEIEYLKVTKQNSSSFLEELPIEEFKGIGTENADQVRRTATGVVEREGNVTRHRLLG